MAQMKIVYTTSVKLDDLEITNGQIIFVADTHTIYMDMKGRRTSYSTIYVFETEDERLAYENPTPGFYYVDETHVVWRYRSNWIQITPNNLNPIVFGEEVSFFPLRGEEGVLYVANKVIYKWNAKEDTYQIVANVNEWEEI